MQREDEYFEDDPGNDQPEGHDDGSPVGLWKLHRLQESNPDLHQSILDVLKGLRPHSQPLVVPELAEEIMQQPGPPLGPQLLKKLTILVTGPVMVPGRDDKVVRILWDDVAQVLLQEDCLPSPITLRILPPATPSDTPVLLTIIAAGGNDDWEAMRIMSRSQLGACLEESGMLLRGSRQQAAELAAAALDSVDAVLYCDRLHKYHLTLSDQDLIKRLTDAYGAEFWARTALCLTNDGYAFPPVGMSFPAFVEQRASSIAAEVAATGVPVASRRRGGFLGLVGGRRIHAMPTCVVDGNEMFIPPQEDGSAPLPLLPDGTWSPVNLLRAVLAVARQAGGGYEYPQGQPAPSEGLEGRVVPQVVAPKPPKKAPKAPRQKKEAGGGPLGAGMPGMPGAQKPSFGPQAMQWEMQVQGDRVKLQERRKEVESRGWLRAVLGRVASSDLKWLPYVVIAQVMLYRRVFVPLVDYFREKDLHYMRLEYESRKAEREAIGLQPPRGLEVQGIYIDEPWGEGEAYVRRLERMRRQELERLQAGK